MNNRSEQAMSECRAKLAAATEAERSGDIKGADALGAEAGNKVAVALGLPEVKHVPHYTDNVYAFGRALFDYGVALTRQQAERLA